MDYVSILSETYHVKSCQEGCESKMGEETRDILNMFFQTLTLLGGNLKQIGH